MDNRRVLVHYLGLARNIVGREEEEIRECNCATVQQVLDILIQKYGEGFRDSLLAGSGLLRPTAMLFVDGTDINKRGGLDAPLGPNTEISIAVVTHALAGG